MTDSGTTSSTTWSSKALPTADVCSSSWCGQPSSLQSKGRSEHPCSSLEVVETLVQSVFGGKRDYERWTENCIAVAYWSVEFSGALIITRYWPVRISSRSLRVWSCWITVLHRSWTFHSKGISLGKWSKRQESRWISLFVGWGRKRSSASLKMLMRQ